MLCEIILILNKRFYLNYEGLKPVLIAAQQARTSCRFYLNYEGLKHSEGDNLDKSNDSFYLNYEGLKLSQLILTRTGTPCFYLNYEGLKQKRAQQAGFVEVPFLS